MKKDIKYYEALFHALQLIQTYCDQTTCEECVLYGEYNQVSSCNIRDVNPRNWRLVKPNIKLME